MLSYEAVFTEEKLDNSRICVRMVESVLKGDINE